jgi:ribosomal protein S18 acetylase RimI-like enzyme
MPATDEALLDNPVYAALSTVHAGFAQICGRAARYQADVAPFLAMPADPSPEDWQCAAELVTPDGFAAIMDPGAVPETWRTLGEFELVQMIGEDVSGVTAPEATRLGSQDVPEMLELVRETEPGPFFDRTIELGDYFGIRREGRLVAMGGERLRLDGWTEISAVCTATTHRGHGMASRLMGTLIARIEGRSERVFLHVLTGNTGAIRLYEALGFQIRRQGTLSVLAPVPSPVQEA